MKQRFITSIFIVLASVLAIASKLLPNSVGNYFFDIFILIILIIASLEVCAMLKKAHKKVNEILVLAYCISNYITILMGQQKLEFNTILLLQILLLVFHWLLIFIIEYFKNKDLSMKQNLYASLNTLLVCIYPCFFLGLLLNFNHADFYAGVKHFSLIFIMLIFAITWLTDTCAYLVGRTFKGPKLAPKISPNKTISGAIGGLLGGIVGSALIYLLSYNIPALNAVLMMYGLNIVHFMLIGMIGSVLGQVGDLFESKLKRNVGVKDSGNIFPGHGGMLDRVDAMIFVSTFMYLVVFVLLM